MKKMIMFLTICTLNSLQCYYSRIIPLAFDKQKNEWSFLLGHTRGDNWNDFGAQISPFDDPRCVAIFALKNQTNGIYSVSLQNAIKKQNSRTGDLFYFVPVSYIPGKTLYKSARTKWKDNFAWVNESELMNKRPSVKPISQQFLTFFISHWPSVKKELTKKTARKISSSWFGIPGAIYFYKKTNPYYEFTNFAEGYPIFVDGKWWPTTEQYYQAMKFNDKNLQETIRSFKSDRQGSAARKAFDFARKNSNKVRPDWQHINLLVMLKAVRDKFNRYPTLRKMLVNTSNAVLIENAGANDNFFGAGADGKGANHLGQILMHVRNELISKMQKAYIPKTYKEY